jgi:hypothetical protein
VKSMKRRPEWVAQTVRRIHSTLGNPLVDLNGWELEFLEKVKRSLREKNELADAQENKLLSILSRR